jgi:hypothetical protein
MSSGRWRLNLADMLRVIVRFVLIVLRPIVYSGGLEGGSRLDGSYSSCINRLQSCLVLTMNGMICCMVKTENRRRHRPYTLSTTPLTKSVTLDEVPN